MAIAFFKITRYDHSTNRVNRQNVEITIMTQKVAFFLSGSGYLDGSEITEATALIISLSKYNIDVDFYAPNRAQSDVINHLTQTTETHSRNILVEASRITRGNISPLEEFNAQRYSAVILPGGFGAVKNFSDFLHKGVEANLTSDIQKALDDALTHNLWIVGICAAPLIIALALRDHNLSNCTITFGELEDNHDFNNALKSWGIQNVNTKINEINIDCEHKLITSGAYMFHDASPYDIYCCSDFIIKSLLEKLSDY